MTGKWISYAKAAPLQSFWVNVRIGDPDECWPWTGSKQRKGYGTVNRFKRQWVAHRFAWEMMNGPIPEGMLVCHKCDNPPCCNPAHLFLGTNKENLMDCVAKGRHAETRKTHCKHGHAFTPDNILRFPGDVRIGRLRRECRTCDHERGVRRWSRSRTPSKTKPRGKGRRSRG